MATVRRTESEAVRREQILRATRKVLNEKGYDDATISEIMREAGLAAGTFYLYFGSKKDAIMALGRQVLDEAADLIIASHDPSLPFDEQLRILVKLKFDVGRRNPDLCKLLNFGAESAGQELKESLEFEGHPLFEHMAGIFRQAIDSEQIAPIDIEIAVRLLNRLLLGLIQEAFVFGDSSDSDRIEEAATNIVVNAFAKR